jgi:uncharacterized membrane protein
MLPLALIAFCGLGLMLSAVTLRRMRAVESPRDPVLGSPDARVFGFPNAWISFAYFGAVMAFGVLRLCKIPFPIWPFLLAATLSLAMSIYLATRLARLRRF